MARVGVDVGGTHIDFVLVDDERGEIAIHKVPTSVRDASLGAIEGLAELCRQAGIRPGDIDYFMHGTTIATNIILEHNGAKCGLITTEGFRDVLHIARHKRPHNFSLQLDLPWQKHELVPRRARKTVRERIAGGDSAVLVPLDEDAVRRAARELRAAGVESIAVCFLFSFLNPAHERRAAEIIAEEAPGIALSLSHEVVPLYREYERFSTTCLNAYVGPKSVRYLENFDRALRDVGMTAGLRRRGSRALLLRQGRRGAHRDRLRAGPRSHRPGRIPRRAPEARRGARAPRGRSEARAPTRHERRGSGARGYPDPHPRHGAGDRVKQRAPRLRPARVRAGRLRRRGAPRRLRHRARALDPGGDRAARSGTDLGSRAAHLRYRV